MKFPYEVRSKLRNNTDNFVLTIYKEDRYILGISWKDILLIKINNSQLIVPVNEDYQISIPKNLIKFGQQTVSFSILKIIKYGERKSRPKKIIESGFIDLRAFVPLETIFGSPIFIIPQNEEQSYYWYSHGGGVKPVLLNNLVDFEKLAEFIGFYFGDGSTSEKIRSFRITNCEPTTLIYCLNFLETVGIDRKEFKGQVIYTSPNEITDKIKKKCSAFWSQKLGINEKSIVSVNRSKGLNESLMYGSIRLYIDSSVIVELFLNGIMKHVLERITFPKNEEDLIMAVGFLRGLMAAEGAVFINKNGSVIRIGVAFDPHSQEDLLFRKILANLKIEVKKSVHGNELIIGKYSNFKKLFQMDVFRMHEKRKEKFIKGFLKHKFSKTLVFQNKFV